MSADLINLVQNLGQPRVLVVGDVMLDRYIWGDAERIMALAGQQHKAHQVSQRVHQRDDFGRQSAARAPDGLILSPPFAPLAFWWAVTIVPSIRAYSKSGSPDRHSKICSKTPARTQRRKR